MDAGGTLSTIIKGLQCDSPPDIMRATAAVAGGATLQPGVDDHRHLVELPSRRFWTCAPEFSGRQRMHGSMQNVAPVINQAHQGGTLRLAFLSAVVSLVISFAAAAAPIPLYNIYRADDGFTNAGISMAVVAYAAGTIAALLVLGRLSNHLGRRLTAIASLGLILLGCLLLLNVHDIGTLLAGRLLVGVGTGLASSSLTSYIVDAAPSRPEWLASVASSQGPMLGLTVGAIASGALVQFGPWPRDLIYLVCVGFLLLSAALIAISPETATPTPGAWRSLLPRVRVPDRVRHLLPVAAAVFLATWATGAFYQAFVPALVEDQLHTRSPLILGLVFAAYMTPSVLGAPIGGRFTSAVAQRVGMITFLAGMIGIITAIAAGTLVLFIIATIVAGAGQGIAIGAATRGLLHGSALADRAPIFSAIYLLCYSGAAFPSLISGELSNTFSLPQIAFGYGVLAVVATLFTVLCARNPHADATGNSNIATFDDDVAAFNPTERISGKTIIRVRP
jgi:MFS family permease